MTNDFNLADYLEPISTLARVHSVDEATAVEYFIVNLSTMRDQYPGLPKINFRTLGQKWNSLNYKIRNNQKTAVISLLKNRGKTSSTRNRRSIE